MTEPERVATTPREVAFVDVRAPGARWFDALDTRDDSVNAHRPSVDDGLAVVVLDESRSASEVADEIEADDVKTFRCLPFLVCRTDPSAFDAIVAVRGVGDVVAAPPGSRDALALVEGIDQLMAFERYQRDCPVGAPDLVGGRAQGDADGLPTPAALMPVVNLSVGTLSVEHVARMDDPVNMATLAASRWQLVVVAAGNAGAAAGETMSSWAQGPWVLSVGATTDPNGSELAPYSSRGVSGHPDSGPDLVAYGASELNERKTGTSFAAPRVSRMALIVSAAILQVRSIWLEVNGHPPSGVPLVGCGYVDVGFERMRKWHRPLPGLPRTGVVPATDDIIGIARDADIALAPQGSPSLVRQLLLRAARPVIGNETHEVGAGFLDYGIVLDHLAAMTGLDLVRAIAADRSQLIDARTAAELERRSPFDRDGLEHLMEVVLETHPIWAFDYRLGRVGRIP